ncbi:MAG: ABC transporter ATP-binding protein [Burkholderiales bacterium]|jgi:iron complex transport system ATP-binding protein|nr:ABC transporter ATP-binding protein [Burkholderiales bacterium]
MSANGKVASLDRVAVGYKQWRVVDDITFEFIHGKVVCLLGANGCGKTTLLRTLLGTLPVISGVVMLSGKPLAEWSRRELARFISYVPQAHHGIFPFSAEEVVLMGRTARMSWYAIPDERDKQMARSCLKTLGIEHLYHRSYTQLSGGERQLVLLARALAQEPQFLIMDEPTASLDFGNQIRVLEQIRHLKNGGMTILMTTHQPEHAWHVADEVVLIHGGRVKGAGAPAEMLTVANLSEVYDIDENTLKANLALRHIA